MAGYSKTSLAKKLGYKPGMKVYLKNAPPHYMTLITPHPADVTFLARLSNNIDMIHSFTMSRKELTRYLEPYMSRVKPNGMIWISWPKKASKVETDITEDAIRDIALPLGLVDVKVCAVDDVWSGLKLVIRKENRAA